jgi:hypothetical protein
VPPAPAFQSFPESGIVTGRVTQVSTGPKKPTKAAGKQQQTSVQTAHAAPHNGSSIRSPLGQRLRALQERYLGPPFGEPGSLGRLQDETSKCESSTKRAILDAHDTEKLEAFDAGFSGLQESLCSAAVACYSDCFKLAEDNRSECDAPPAEFASSFALKCLSTFLRVTPWDGAEAPREINSNGRVRWFVRHVCGDWSDNFPDTYGLRPGQNLIFHLPHYLSGVWMVRAKVATRRRVEAPATSLLSMKETEKFILDTEQTLIKRLRDAIADAHRDAVVETPKAIVPEKLTDGPAVFSVAAQHEVWTGTDRSLADKILQQYASGQIVAGSRTDALKRACVRYVRKNGTHYNPRSLWQNIKNREADGK